MKTSLRRRLEILEVAYGKTRRVEAQLRYLKIATEDEINQEILEEKNNFNKPDDEYVEDEIGVPMFSWDDLIEEGDRRDNAGIKMRVLKTVS